MLHAVLGNSAPIVQNRDKGNEGNKTLTEFSESRRAVEAGSCVYVYSSSRSRWPDTFCFDVGSAAEAALKAKALLEA